jgi:hypothetical protein
VPPPRGHPTLYFKPMIEQHRAGAVAPRGSTALRISLAAGQPKRGGLTFRLLLLKKIALEWPQDAALVVGRAQDAFVLPAAFGRRARGLPGTLLDRLTHRPGKRTRSPPTRPAVGGSTFSGRATWTDAGGVTSATRWSIASSRVWLTAHPGDES